MGLVAVILRTPNLQLDEWIRRIKATEEIVSPPPWEARNPFSGQLTTVAASAGTAEIVASGVLVGAIEPSAEFADDGELHVYAPERPSGALRSIVTTVAEAMGAEVQWAV